VAACGGTGANSPRAAQSKRYQKSLAFVQCMRSHGEPTFPDPTSQGIISDEQASLNSPVLIAAARACATLMPPGALQLTEAQQQQLETRALKRAECMRAHGVVNFPDPSIGQDHVNSSTAGTSIDPNSPVFQAAARACDLHAVIQRSVHGSINSG
jgi:hypothetical protein